MDITADELEHGATWLEEYNDGETEGPNGYDEVAATMFKVAKWLREEADRRYRADLIAKVAKEHGLRKNSARARQAVDAHLASKR